MESNYRDYSDFQSQNRQLNAQRSSLYFGIASMIFGIISILGCCTGFVAMVAGSLGILFFVLSKRKGKSANSYAWIGLGLSVVGFALGTILIAYTMFAIVIPIMTDPEAYRHWDEIYKTTYGIGLDEIMNYGR